jgi:hemerythrin-like metal-binding protein
VEKQFVVWDDKYSIGVKDVDEQHKELFKLTNELYEACTSRGAAAVEHTKSALQKAVSYVVMHFSMEESLMERFSDPNFESHKEEHDLFVREVIKDAANLEQMGEEASVAFMNFLKGWISKHVTGTDIKIGHHIAALKAQGVLKPDAVL